MPQKIVKGQAMTDFLADHPVLGNSKLYDDLSDEIAEVCGPTHQQKNKYWRLFFDDALRTGPRGNIIAAVG